MMLILSFVLFPLGLIALLASLQSARDNSAGRADQTLTRLETKAQRINTLLSRTEDTIRAAAAAISLTPRGSVACRNTVEWVTRRQGIKGRYAFYAPGNEIRCATPGYAPPPILAANGRRSLIEIGEDGEHLLFAAFDDRGDLKGTAEFPRSGLSDLTFLAGTSGDFDLDLRQGTRRMVLRNGYEGNSLVQPVRAAWPVADGRLELNIVRSVAPISALELLMILLPVMMWIAAAILGWFILDRLLLRPLVRMQRAVSAYQPGDEQFDIPTFSTPAREIGELGLAFNQVTRTVARHEADLKAAIDRQTRLVREVHHRVKNNLQVVASLLNLHARGAASDDVAAAYASIQRRVDALAVVHRNHFAELEENQGVALKSLISELGANLRATAPASAAGMTIRLDVDPCYASQDVAVSVAFLITEVVEFAMFCGAASVTVSLNVLNASSASLELVSDSLKGGIQCDEKLSERFDRIVTGLSRQLRSTLERDIEKGRYSLLIAIVDKDG